MSHSTTTRLPGMKDRKALIAAAEKLGCSVTMDGKAKLFGRNTAKGEVVLSHPQANYDVAMNKVNGFYEATTDFFDGSVDRVYSGPNGEKFGRLIALYGAEVAKRIAKLHGYQVKESADQKTGVITLKVVVS